jgi:hypothetical protein
MARRRGFVMRGKAGLFSRFREFAPTNFAGLSAWFDASDDSTLFDSNSGGSATSSDGEVGRMEDKSGNGRHFFQATSADRSIRKTSAKNGLDVIRFDGAGDYMEMSGLMSDLIAASASSVFIVAKAASVTSNEADIYNNQTLFGDNGLWHGFFVLKDNNTASVFGYAVGGSDPTATVSYTPSNWVVFTAWHDGSNLSAAVNSGSPATASMASRDQLTNTPVLGITRDQSNPGYTAKFFDGDLGEMLVYNTALSGSQRLAVESYLAAKWGIS